MNPPARGREGTTSTTSQSDPAPAPIEPVPGEVATVDPPEEPPPVAEDAEEPPEEAPPPRVRGPLWAKLLIAFGTVLLVLATGTVVTALVLVHRYDSAVHHADLLDPGSRVQPGSGNGPAHIVGPLNFLLLGSDARANDPIDGQRSDTIIILHIPKSMDHAYLISIPRDLRVHIPPDPDLGFQGSYEKINGAFNYGGGGISGFQLVSKTLTQLIGIRFDGAGIIDFEGFQKVVRLLGGVDMCVDAETKSIHTGAVYHVGCQHLAPWQALDYVRQRKSLVDDDYGRERHQQQFLKAIFQEAMDQGLAHNPVRLDQFVQSVGDSLTLDTNGMSVIDLALALRGITPSTLTGLKVPSYGQYIGGISYVLPYEEQAAGLYQAIAADTLDTWVTANPTWVNHV